ncbi:MAG: Tm-1-like ATP-binding domain-containing protein [Desulfobaccales bacterium]
MPKTVLIIATLDTKAEEALFIKDRLASQGLEILIMDGGSLGQPPAVADINRTEVAARAGYDLAALLHTADKGRIIAGMTAGLTAWVRALYQEGRIHGVLALGGGQGTAMGTAAMQVLPLGFPKVMVTTLAAGNLRPFLETKDIAVFPSVADMLGMNRILALTLGNAANALAAMVLPRPVSQPRPRYAVGATAFGVTTPGLMKLRDLLQGPDLEMVFFHATGIGGAALESLAEDGWFDLLLAWTTHEVVDLLAGGIFAARPDYLDLLARREIPCLVSVGAIDYICQGPLAELDKSWQDRNIIVHNRNITLVRARPAEMVRAAAFLAEKLNRARGPVKVMIPLEGFSEPNARGKQFYDPEADLEFTGALKAALRRDIEVIELPHHINDEAFVERAAREISTLLPGLAPGGATAPPGSKRTPKENATR